MYESCILTIIVRLPLIRCWRNINLLCDEDCICCANMWCLVPGNMIVRVASKNRPGYYWAIDEGIEGYLMTEAEMFKVLSPGLWGEGSISFESVTRPGRYIRHRDGKIWVEEGNLHDDAFKKECSWFARQDHFFTGFVSFESVYQPGYFIRHHSRRLEMTEIFSNQDRSIFIA